MTTTTADAPISFETQANQSEWIEASRAIAVARIRDGDPWQAIRWLLPPLAGALIGGAYGPLLQRSYAFPTWEWIIAGAGLALLGRILNFFRYTERAARASATNGPSRYAVSNEGIREINPPRGYAGQLLDISVGADDGSRLFPWSAFRGYLETQRVIVLLFKKRASLVIAKRYLSSIDAARLKSIFSQNLRQV